MEKVKKVWKIAKKVLFWIFFVCLFLITTITVILHIYEDEIKEYAIAELNSYLKEDVEVGRIDVSIFHQFPRASIGFENVFIADAFDRVESNDTLLYAEEFYFHFNLWDIWSGDYKVKRASIHKGQLNLKTTSDGDVNYNILKEPTDTVETEGSFRFLLELFRVEDMVFSLYNQSTNQDYKIGINEALIRGDFAETNYALNAEAELYVERIKSGSLTLLSEKNASLNLDMDINSDKESYIFKKGDLFLEAMEFSMFGAIDSSTIDLDVVGKNIQVSQLISSVIPKNSEYADKYDGQGVVNFKSKIKGPLNHVSMPSIEADFSVQNGTLIDAESKLKIQNIQLLGHYANAFNARLEKLDFKKFSMKLLNSEFSGTGTVEDFTKPLLTTVVKGNLDLAEFHRFFKFKDVEELAGTVRFDMTSSVRFFDPEYHVDKFHILSSEGNLQLNKIAFKSRLNHLRYADISGQVLISGRDAATKDLSVKTNKSDLLINGAFKNIMGYIEGTGNLGLIASLESNQIDLNEFLGPSNQQSQGPPTMFELPGNLNLNLEMHVKNFKWDKHQFTNITGQFLLANRVATVNQIQMNTLGGLVKGRLVLTNLLENGNSIEGTMFFSAIDIKKLFSEWDNFQQETIQDKHLAGKVDGTVNFLLLFNPYFSLSEERIFAVSDIKITNGELNELETMKAITDYLRSNAALKLMLNKHIDKFEDKLMHLKFAELSNKIEIRDRRIVIPKMLIKSNALDVELFGWHDFDNNIEYHFSFRFKQLKSVPESTEFGKIADDGLGIVIYLTMSGNIDEPVFSLDKEERINDIKEMVASEKADVKSILKTEFGFFQKDTTVKTMQVDNKKEVEFIYYDTDLENDQPDSVGRKPKNKTRSDSFFNKLKEDAKNDKEEVIFE
jgi:hypothetical protein